MADGIDDGADVVRRREVAHRHLARRRVDRDLGDLGGEGRDRAVRLGIVEVRRLQRSPLSRGGLSDRGQGARGLSELRGLRLDLFLELFGRVIRGAAARVRDPAPAHAGVRREVVGGGDFDLHLVEGQAEHLGDDLTENEVGAGPRVGQRHQHGYPAVGLQAHAGIRESHPDVAVCHGGAAADPRPGLGLGPMARLERGLERLGGSYVLEMVAVGEEIAVAQKVPPAELGRIQRELSGDHVHLRLPGEDHLGLAGRPGVTARDVVAIDAERFDQEMGNPVDAGAHAGSSQIHARRRLEGGVGAAVEERLHAPGDDPPVLAHAGAQRDDGWVARIARHQLLGVPHDHLDRPSGRARQVIGEREIHHRTLAPEVAADGSQVDSNLRGREL